MMRKIIIYHFCFRYKKIYSDTNGASFISPEKHLFAQCFSALSISFQFFFNSFAVVI